MTTAIGRELLSAPSRPTPPLDELPLAPVARPGASLAVLDVTEFFGETSGGIRTYLLEKARYMAAHPNLRHVLVVPGGRDAITEVSGVRCYRLRGPRLPRHTAYRLMLAPRATRRVVEHERPDVIEVGSPGLVPWMVRGSAQRLGIPLVYFYHSHFPDLVPGRLRSLAWEYARAIDRMFAMTVVASRFAERELHAAGIARTVRIPLGVDVGLFTPRRRGARDATRRRFGIPLDQPVALYVGRMAREKRLEPLLRGWPAVSRRTGAHLVLVGEGAEQARLVSLSRGSAVQWIPFVQDRERLADLVAACDVMIAPGDRETFGLAALEGLASGTPLVAAHRGAAAEHVEASGAGALFSEDGRAAPALDAAMAAVLQADSVTLGGAARAYATREHDWGVVFDRLVALYETVAGQEAR